MSPLGTPLEGRPTTGEKENTEQTKQRPRQSRLDEPSHFDAELNFPWGDEMRENPMTPLPRIFFQNVNGIALPTNLWQRLEFGYNANVNKVDILCMAETNLDWDATKNWHECDNI
jgi:hypothetical protein